MQMSDDINSSHLSMLLCVCIGYPVQLRHALSQVVDILGYDPFVSKDNGTACMVRTSIWCGIVVKVLEDQQGTLQRKKISVIQFQFFLNKVN